MENLKLVTKKKTIFIEKIYFWSGIQPFGEVFPHFCTKLAKGVFPGAFERVDYLEMCFSLGLSRSSIHSFAYSFIHPFIYLFFSLNQITRVRKWTCICAGGNRITLYIRLHPPNYAIVALKLDRLAAVNGVGFGFDFILFSLLWNFFILFILYSLRVLYSGSLLIYANFFTTCVFLLVGPMLQNVCSHASK